MSSTRVHVEEAEVEPPAAAASTVTSAARKTAGGKRAKQTEDGALR